MVNPSHDKQSYAAKAAGVPPRLVPLTLVPRTRTSEVNLGKKTDFLYGKSVFPIVRNDKGKQPKSSKGKTA